MFRNEIKNGEQAMKFIIIILLLAVVFVLTRFAQKGYSNVRASRQRILDRMREDKDDNS